MNAQTTTVERPYGRPILASLHGAWSVATLVVTQDTFLMAYKALPRVAEEAVGVWLYRIATHTARDATVAA